MGADLTTFELDESSRRHFQRLLTQLRAWSQDHPVMLGVGEMALGGALIATGAKQGILVAGIDLMFTRNTMTGLASGLPTAVALCLLGGIGVAGAGGAIGVPAAVLVLGGGAMASLAGYAVGDIVQRLIDPVTLADMFVPGALLLAGAALMVDGARRILGDVDVASGMARLKDFALQVTRLSADLVLETAQDVQAWLVHNLQQPQAGLGTVGTLVAGGLAGHTLAAGSVSVLGSKALGAAALSMGFVSAPLWPVLLGVAAAGGVSFAVWRWSARRHPH